MAAKQICTQARINGVIMWHSDANGKSHRRDEVLKAMDAITAAGGDGEIRQQVIGARGWARFRYTAGDGAAYQDSSIVWND